MAERRMLSDYEADFRARLAGRSLVMEAGIEEGEALLAFERLGYHLAQTPTTQERIVLARRLRGIVLAGVTAIASRSYQDGTLWPSIFQALGQRQSQARQKELGDAFVFGLTKLGLRRFDTPLRFVGEFLLHSGVPTSSVESLVQTLTRRAGTTTGMSAHSFVGWVATLQREALQGVGLDTPTWRFLTEGGEIAEDYVERVLAILDSDEGDIDAAVRAASLPAPTTAAVLSARHATSASRRSHNRSAATGRTRTAEPHVRWDSSTGNLELELPPLQVQIEADLNWRLIGEGGFFDTLSVNAPWPGDPVLPSRVALSAPVREVAVSVDLAKRSESPIGEWLIPVIDDRLLLLAFDATSGALIAGGHPLPKPQVVLGYPQRLPGTANETTLLGSDRVRVIERLSPPVGWESWIFERIDTNDLAWIKLSAGDQNRRISTDDRPHLTSITPVPQAKTVEGLPLTSTRPRLRLPASRQHDGVDAAVTWTVSVLNRLVPGTEMATEIIVGDEPVTVPLFDSLEPVLGDFTVSARGPLGRGLTARVVVIENLAVTAVPEHRLLAPDGHGLEEAVVKINHLPRADPRAEFRLSGGETAKTFEVVNTDLGTLSIQVGPPHLLLTPITDGRPKRASIAAIDISIEQLDTCDLRFGGVPLGWGEVLLTGESGTLMNASVQPDRNGVIRVGLSQFTDSAAAAGVSELKLRMLGRESTIARLAPERLWRSVTVVDGYLTFVPTVPIDRVALSIFPTNSPWLPRIEVDAVEAAAGWALPSSLLDEGTITVLALPRDPWLPTVWPDVTQLDGDRNAVVIRFGEPSESNDTPDERLRRWFALGAPFPQHDDVLDSALSVYTKLRSIRVPRSRREVRMELAQYFTTKSHELVKAGVSLELDRRGLMRLLVDSGAVMMAPATLGLAPDSWNRSPALAMLGTCQELEGGGSMAPLLRSCGSVASEILATGVDPHPRTGRFNDIAQQMSEMSPERINSLWAAAAPVPGGILEEDSRMLHARQLFDARDKADYRTLSVAASEDLRLGFRILASVSSTAATGSVKARCTDQSWRNIPALSIMYALISRFAARGNEACLNFAPSFRDRYARLAYLAPDLVEQDIVLAELLIQGWNNHDRN